MIRQSWNGTERNGLSCASPRLGEVRVRGTPEGEFGSLALLRLYFGLDEAKRSVACIRSSLSALSKSWSWSTVYGHIYKPFPVSHLIHHHNRLAGCHGLR